MAYAVNEVSLNNIRKVMCDNILILEVNLLVSFSRFSLL